MKQYHDLVARILAEGVAKPDRTGTGTLSLFGEQMRFDLRAGFPLLTTKRVHWKSVVHELLWFIAGDTNVRYLRENGVTIWDEWADAEGSIGPAAYGKQWRAFDGPDGKRVDQLATLLDDIRRSPDSRRLIVTAWNPTQLDQCALPPCHSFWQVYTTPEGWMDLQLTQRSADCGLGVPFNVASYALLLSMIAQVTGYRPRYFIHALGDVHIYRNHVEALREQLSRQERPLPRLVLDPSIKSLFDFRFEHIGLQGYDPHPAIKMDVAV